MPVVALMAVALGNASAAVISVKLALMGARPVPGFFKSSTSASVSFSGEASAASDVDSDSTDEFSWFT